MNILNKGIGQLRRSYFRLNISRKLRVLCHICKDIFPTTIITDIITGSILHALGFNKRIGHIQIFSCHFNRLD